MIMLTSIHTLTHYITDVTSQTPKLLVAIDGRAGAGKSSLARLLAQQNPLIAHIEYDWFHLPQHEIVTNNRYDHARLISEIITPFKNGAPKLACKRYNWGYLAGIADGFHEEPAIFEEKEIIMVEGCQSLNQALLPYFDVKIWVDTPPEVAYQRGIRRDIDEYKLDPEKVHATWSEWKNREDESLAKYDRRLKADILFYSEE